MRVFVNHVDSYTGRELSKASVHSSLALSLSFSGVLSCNRSPKRLLCVLQVLAGSVVGATAGEKDAGEDADSKPPSTSEQSVLAQLQVCGANVQKICCVSCVCVCVCDKV